MDPIIIIIIIAIAIVALIVVVGIIMVVRSRVKQNAYGRYSSSSVYSQNTQRAIPNEEQEMATNIVSVETVNSSLSVQKKNTQPQRSQKQGNPTELYNDELNGKGKLNKQEDFCWLSNRREDPLELLVVVCDGEGTLPSGSPVSEIAVNEVSEVFGRYRNDTSIRKTIMRLVYHVNQAVNSEMADSIEGTPYGSTMVLGYFRNGYLSYASVGDSRICLLRDGELIQLNREHVYRNYLTLKAMNGFGSIEDALNNTEGSELVSYLGMGELSEVDMPACDLKLLKGDVFIFMTDGVYLALNEDEIKKALRARNTTSEIERMIRNRNYRDQDNYTAVIVKCV